MKNVYLIMVMFSFFIIGCSHEQKEASTDEKITEEKSNLVKDRNGEVVEIYLKEGEDNKQIPEGWTVIGKKYDPYTGKRRDVYRHPLTTAFFKDKFNQNIQKNFRYWATYN